MKCMLKSRKTCIWDPSTYMNAGHRVHSCNPYVGKQTQVDLWRAAGQPVELNQQVLVL